MNSFGQLNAVGASVIEVSDSRPATVIFDKDTRYFDPDQLVSYTTNIINFTPSINIEEIINYATANARFRVEIITSGADPGTITFATMPTGLTLTQAGTVYTITGIKDSVQWSTISTFTWTMPATYAIERLYYLKLSIIYYDEDLNSEQTLNWIYYDENFFFDYLQNVQFNLNIEGTRLKRASATLITTFDQSAIPPQTMSWRFVMLAQGEPTSFVQITTAISQQITASKLVNIASNLNTTATINYNSNLANILVNTITTTSTYTRIGQAIFTPDLSKVLVLAYSGLTTNGSAGNWGILYYDFNRITNTLTFNQFIAIEAATYSTLDPNPKLEAYEMETSETGELTSVWVLKRDGTSSYTYSDKLYGIIKSTGSVLATINSRYISVSPDAQRRVYCFNTTNRRISIRSSTGTDLGSTANTADYYHYPNIRYNTSTGVYWLAAIESSGSSATAPTPGVVRLWNSTDNYTTSLNLSGISTIGTNSPNNLTFDSTGTYLVALTGYTGYNPENTVHPTAPEIYIFRYNGTTWVQHQYFKIYETWTNAPFHRTRFSRIHVSKNARQIQISLEGSSTTSYSLLYEWTGSSYTLKVTNFNEYAVPPISVQDFNSLSSIDRYYILQDQTTIPNQQTIYRYQG